jgi:hypothetical protein
MPSNLTRKASSITRRNFMLTSAAASASLLSTRTVFADTTQNLGTLSFGANISSAPYLDAATVGLSVEKQFFSYLANRSNVQASVNSILKSGSSIRFGGGTIDSYNCSSGQNCISKADLYNYLYFAQQNRYSTIYGVDVSNYSTDLVDLSDSVPYNLSRNTIFIEQGNESENVNENGGQSVAQWYAQLPGLQHVVNGHGFKIAGPASERDVTAYGYSLFDCAANYGATIFTGHYYHSPIGGVSSAYDTDLALMDPTSPDSWQNDSAAGDTPYITAVNFASTGRSPIRFGECGPINQSVCGCSYAAALRALDIIFGANIGGIAGFNFHSGYLDTATHNVYTPLSYSDGTLYPTGYAMKMASMICTSGGGAHQIHVYFSNDLGWTGTGVGGYKATNTLVNGAAGTQGGNPNISAYAFTHNDGSNSVLIINKTGNTIHLTANGYNPTGGTYWILSPTWGGTPTPTGNTGMSLVQGGNIPSLTFAVAGYAANWYTWM